MTTNLQAFARLIVAPLLLQLYFAHLHPLRLLMLNYSLNAAREHLFNCKLSYDAIVPLYLLTGTLAMDCGAAP